MPISPAPVSTPITPNPADYVPTIWAAWFNQLQAGGGDTAVTRIGTAIAGASQSTSDLKGDRLSLGMFAPAADGLTDDAATLQTAITAAQTAGKALLIPGGSTYRLANTVTLSDAMTLEGDGYSSWIRPDTAAVGVGETIIVTGSNVRIANLRFNGACGATISIKSGASNVLVENCWFENVNQCVYLLACSNVTVRNCYFETCLYGVIQKVGFSSSHVLVEGCTAWDMTADFVEANCTNAAPSSDWIVVNNRFLGSHDYPTPQTEQRFCGFTSVSNVTVAHNYVLHVAGDAAVHLEDTLGNVIVEGNHFVDCLSPFGYILLLTAPKNCIIRGNYIVRTDSTLPVTYALYAAAGAFDYRVIFDGNHLIGDAARKLSGFILGDCRNLTISNNVAEYLDHFVDCARTSHIMVQNNRVLQTNYGLWSFPGVVGGANTDWTVSGNRFECLTAAVAMQGNSLGSAGSHNKRFLVVGNFFGADANSFDTDDWIVVANTYAAGVAFNLNGTLLGGSSRFVSAHNVQEGTGIADAMTSLQRINMPSVTTGLQISGDATGAGLTGLYLGDIAGTPYVASGANHLTAATWTAHATEASIIEFLPGAIVFLSDSGLTPGAVYTPSEVARFPVSAAAHFRHDMQVDGNLTVSGSFPTVALPNVGTPGTYGDATHVAQLTTDAQGRVTAATPVAITNPGVTAVRGEQNATLTVNTTPTNIPGVAVTLTRTGEWLVMTSLQGNYTAGDGALLAQLYDATNSLAKTPTLYFGTYHTGSQSWLYTSAAGNETLTMQGWKQSGSGGSAFVDSGVNNSWGTLTAVWLHS